MICIVKGRNLISALPHTGQCLQANISTHRHITSHNHCYVTGNGCQRLVCRKRVQLDVPVRLTHTLRRVCNAEYSNAPAWVALLISGMYGMRPLPSAGTHTRAHTQKHAQAPLQFDVHTCRGLCQSFLGKLPTDWHLAGTAAAAGVKG